MDYIQFITLLGTILAGFGFMYKEFKSFEKDIREAIAEGKNIDFVFDDSEKCCSMWRRRGIFVFNCAQTEREF